MAVAVTSGAPCLRRFPVLRTGRVLLYAAEDALHVVRERLEGICSAAGVRLANLDIQVITAPTVRLDLGADQQRLAETVSSLRPLLLVLDPFVRLHRIDENVSAEVAPLLAYLRDLQRRFALAVALVHHARKGAARLREGQALRGSSEFHAWGDSNLYLRRRGEDLLLAVEHRAAPSRTGIRLALPGTSGSLALAVLDQIPAASTAQPAASPLAKIEQVLADASEPVPLAGLRRCCHMRTATLCQSLAKLTKSGRVVKTATGYKLAS